MDVIGSAVAVKRWETVTAQLFSGFLDLQMQHAGKPMVRLLDNASVDTAKQIQPLPKVLER